MGTRWSAAACAVACLLVLEGCKAGDGPAEPCGNGAIDEGEVCDGELLGTSPPTCTGEGFRGGEVACAADCLSYDLSGCSGEAVCGNGVVEFPEECDGRIPDGTDCTSRGFAHGTVSCTSSCTLGTGGCVAEYCGDGELSGEEQCDGPDLGGAGCADRGFAGGGLACAATCTFDVSGCTQGCGNGIREGSEACDGEDAAGHTCESEGFVAGVMGCSEDCSALDTSRCAPATPTCTADGGALGTIAVGGAIHLSGDTTGAADDLDLSCQFDLPVPTGELAYEIVVSERGRLHAMASFAWHIVGLVADAGSAESCFTEEVACSNPFFVGASHDLGDVDPGRYYLVVSDWNDVPAPFDVIVTLAGPGGEVCTNRVDDDWDGDVDCEDAGCTGSTACGGEPSCSDGADGDADGRVDCADADCVGSADCAGSACVVDEDLGSLVPYEPTAGNVDVSAQTDDLALACLSGGGPDYVYRFALDAEAKVLVTIDQDASTAHAFGLFLEAGPGSGCTDAGFSCRDLTGYEDTPFDFAAWLSPDPLPAGTYFLVLEGAAGASGRVRLELTAYDTSESACGDGVDNDLDDATDCLDPDCVGGVDCTGSGCAADHDLGTLGIGDSATHEIDTTAATNRLHTVCAATATFHDDGNDFVQSFTLADPAYVWIDVDQSPGSGHAVALAHQAGPGTECETAEALCLDLTDVDASPDASGYLSVPERLPAGTYYLITEAARTAGTVGIRIAAAATPLESDCHDGADDDGDGAVDCRDPQCRWDAGCTARGVYELFEGVGGDAFDLQETMLTLTPVPGHPEGYVWAVRDAPMWPTTPGSGTASRALGLGDDDSTEIELPWSLQLFDDSHDVMSVCSNGILTLGPGTGTASFSEGVASFFERPSIALLWDDLNPAAAGEVTLDELADRVVVTFDGVPETDPVSFDPVGSNDLQAVIWDDGHIDLAWIEVTCADGLAGASDGSAIVNVTGEKDFR